ncbi:MAG: CoA transferase [Dehalococcoidia bacterium]|nr:CoA transferase [Dehalococcoidia bacterium]
MSDLPLDGVRVVEVGGGISAAFATRWLAGYGAEVIRTEGPAGLLTPDEEVYLLAGKRRVAVPDAELRELILRADILVEDGRPGALAARGLDPVALRAAKPELVVVSITPCGQSGPYALQEHTNITVHALGGIMSITGMPHLPPLVNGGSQAYQLGGMNGFSAAVTAYYGALVQGEGDWIDISLQECAAGMLELYGPRTEHTTKEAHVRMGNHTSATWGIYPCVDGFAGVCCLARQVPSLYQVVGEPELMQEKYLDPLQRLENDPIVAAYMYAWFAERTRAEIIALGPPNKVPFAGVFTPGELLDSEQLRVRGLFDQVSTPSGVAKVPGRPFLGFEWRPLGHLSGPAEDTEAVRRDWLGVPA